MRRVLLAVRPKRGFRRVERDAAAPAQVEERAAHRDAVLVDGGGHLAHGGEALGETEADERVIPDERARGLELAQAGSPALDHVERLGEEKRLQGRVGPLDRFADEPELVDRAARLVRRARAAQPVLECPGEELRRRALRRGVGGADRAFERPPRVAGPRRGLRGFEEQVAARDRVDGIPCRERVEGIAERLVVAEPPRHLDAQLEGRPVRRAIEPDPGRVIERGRHVACSERRATRAQRELVGPAGVGLERRRPLPEGDGAGVIAPSLEEIREVPEGSGAARPLREEQGQLIACVLFAPEALLEDRGPPQPHRAQHLLLLGLPAQPLGAASEVLGELVVPTTLDDRSLDRVVGLLVVRVEGEHALPGALGRLEVRTTLVRAREPLEHRDPAPGADAHGDGLERCDARHVVARGLRHSLQRAPALERLRIELAGLGEGTHRALLVATGLPSFGDLGPVIGARCRRSSLACGVSCHARLDLRAPTGRLPRRPQLGLDPRPRRLLDQVHGALEERGRVGERPVRDAGASGREERFGPTPRGTRLPSRSSSAGSAGPRRRPR